MNIKFFKERGMYMWNENLFFFNDNQENIDSSVKLKERDNLTFIVVILGE